MGKHANSDFQLRQVQHSSANGVEAPFLTHLMELLPKDHEGPCAGSHEVQPGLGEGVERSLGGSGCQLDGKCEILLSQLEGAQHRHNPSLLCPFCANLIPRHFAAAQGAPWQGCWNPGISVSSLGWQALSGDKQHSWTYRKPALRSLTAFSVSLRIPAPPWL